MTDVLVEVVDDPEVAGCADLYVTMSIGGQSVRCVLDSGSPRTQLRQAPPGARHVGTRATSGLFGTAPVDEYRVSEVRLGVLHRPTMVIDVLADTPHPVVGLDLLSADAWTLDVARGTLSIGRPPAIGGGHLLERGEHGHVLLRPHWGGLTARALWDTGAGLTLVDHRFVADHPELFTVAGTSTATDLAGEHLELDLARMRGYEIAGVRFDDHVVAITDLSAVPDRTDLVLGYPTVRQARWTMDLPRNTWWVTG